MIRRYKYRSLKKLHKNSVFLLEIRDTKQVMHYCITVLLSYTRMICCIFKEQNI